MSKSISVIVVDNRLSIKGKQMLQLEMNLVIASMRFKRRKTLTKRPLYIREQLYGFSSDEYVCFPMKRSAGKQDRDTMTKGKNEFSIWACLYVNCKGQSLYKFILTMNRVFVQKTSNTEYSLNCNVQLGCTCKFYVKVSR